VAAVEKFLFKTQTTFLSVVGMIVIIGAALSVAVSCGRANSSYHELARLTSAALRLNETVCEEARKETDCRWGYRSER
jgi:hypothetical protein